MPSWSRVLKREVARPAGLFTVEVRPPVRPEPPVPDVEEARDPADLRAEAEALLAEARLTAQRIVREGEARREAIEREAYQAGYREGYAAALAEARAEAERLREEARAVLAQARRLREEIVAASEAQVVELALEAAARVVHAQLEVAPETVVAVVRAALRRLARRRQLVVFVNPQDVDLVRERREELEQELGDGASLYVLADAAVARGGCRVESEGGQVDGTIDGQLSRLRRALLDLVPPAVSAGETEAEVSVEEEVGDLGRGPELGTVS